MPMMNPYANLVRKLDVAGVTFNFPPCLLSERPYILEMHSGLFPNLGLRFVVVLSSVCLKASSKRKKQRKLSLINLIK